MPFPAEAYEINDEERGYWVKNNDGLRCQQIASLKSTVTWVRENRDTIDASIREALGGMPIIHDICIDAIE
jgi:hypothetical protein